LHSVALAGAAYGCAWTAVAMVLLGIWRWRLLSWFVASSLSASPIAYLVLARALGLVLPDSSGWTAIGTWVLAISATIGIFYGARTLGHLANQTQLLTMQASASVAAAFPYLQLYGPAVRTIGHWGHGISSWVGMVEVAAGTAPARDVRIWARDIDGHYFADIGVLLPSAKRRFDIPVASPALAAQCPFSVMVETPADQFRVWLGIVWRQPDRSWEYNLIVAQRNANWDLANIVRDRTDPNFHPPAI